MQMQDLDQGQLAEEMEDSTKATQEEATEEEEDTKSKNS